LLLNPARNRHAEYYADKPLLSFPRDSMHPWQFHNKEFLNNPVSIRRVAAEISGVDDGVGEILRTLQRLGLDDDTLVVFAADQGWMGGQNGLWGMGDHTRPVGAHELMMRIPLIVRHKGRIAPGQTSDLLVSNYDFLPTVLDYLGLGDQCPNSSPGRSFSAVLRGRKTAWENVTFYEMERTRAIRTDRWKYVARQPDGPFELYDLQTDPQERFNLFGQPTVADKQRELAVQLDAFFDRYADPQYDVWKGGRSKAGRLGAPAPKQAAKAARP
jgi:arylsulfatase A-like enzyme